MMHSQTYELKKMKLAENFNQLTQTKDQVFSLKKNTSNLFRHCKDNKTKLDVRSFNRVIHIDREKLEADVEGMTTYEDFVKECLQYSCLPAVVPELKSITVGGALAGVGIESSSFRYGLVHESILEFEAIIGNGDIVLCRPDNEHMDLFYAFPNSYGTLGYALRVKVKLIPAQKFVHIQHYFFDHAKTYFEELNRLCLENRTNGKNEGKIQYIEGVVFDKNKMVITTGKFVDSAPYTSNYQYLNIYYRSLLTRKEDYLKTSDYIWRWDTDWFWCSKFFFMQNFIPRLLFGKFLLKSTRFWKLRKFFNRDVPKKILSYFQKNYEAVIQDVEIPIENSEEFLDFFQKEIGIKPIWICPIMPYRDVTFNFYPMKKETLYINFGFWDVVRSDKVDGFYNRLVERKVQELEGKKGLYSNVYYTENEFWEIYNKSLYEQLKLKYDTGLRLGHIYTKCIEK